MKLEASKKTNFSRLAIFVLSMAVAILGFLAIAQSFIISDLDNRYTSLGKYHDFAFDSEISRFDCLTYGIKLGDESAQRVKDSDALRCISYSRSVQAFVEAVNQPPVSKVTGQKVGEMGTLRYNTSDLMEIVEICKDPENMGKEHSILIAGNVNMEFTCDDYNDNRRSKYHIDVKLPDISYID